VNSAPLVTLADINAARERLRGIATVTPIVSCGEGLWLKAESFQPIGSFKLRGAYNLIAQIPPADRARGVITYSSGNHAQGVAYAARALKIPAVIVMPSDAPQVKIAATRAMGAEIIIVRPDSEERRERAETLAREHGYTIVPPFDHPHIIAGQATCGAEILEQVPAVDLVLAPVGGGGLLSGVAAVIKITRPGIPVIGVEPELAADAVASFNANERVAWTAAETGRTLADGLRSQQIGEHSLPHLLAYVDAILTVTEEEILRAMAYIVRHARIVAEPSGAVTTAAWLFHRDQLPPAKHPVAIVSGGNVDRAVLLQALALD
jgi:threo-3-hydroxy-L-aspartate ammonia-lyase